MCEVGGGAWRASAGKWKFLDERRQPSSLWFTDRRHIRLDSAFPPTSQTYCSRRVLMSKHGKTSASPKPMTSADGSCPSAWC